MLAMLSCNVILILVALCHVLSHCFSRPSFHSSITVTTILITLLSIHYLYSGLLAGTHMLDAGNGFKERILQEVTNLKDFYLSLPFGAATIVGSKKEGEVHVLSAGNCERPFYSLLFDS